MNLTYCKDYKTMSEKAGAKVIAMLRNKRDSLLCAATGHSPGGLYKYLARQAMATPSLFEHIKLLKLDEWGGLPENAPATCEHYLQARVLSPLSIPRERYVSFQSSPEYPEEECTRIQSELDRIGPVDICVLGLGKNGHLGLNEPATSLELYCHIVNLSNQSRQHNMLQESEKQPEYGLTLGMQGIMQAREIILLVSGMGKEDAIGQLLSGKISTTLPASMLWLHQNVDCFIDMASTGMA
jgi:galactosamine-6-phosphate isomerase